MLLCFYFEIILDVVLIKVDLDASWLRLTLQKKVGFDAYVDKLNGHLIRNYFAYIHTSDVR